MALARLPQSPPPSPAPFPISSQMTLNPNTPFILSKTSQPQRNINTSREFTPAKQTEVRRRRGCPKFLLPFCVLGAGTVLFVPAQGGWCSSLALSPACVPGGAEPHSRGYQALKAALCAAGGPEIWAVQVPYPVCSWFACWEMPQGSFLPVLSTFGTRGDLEGPHSRSQGLGMGWGGADPPCIPGWASSTSAWTRQSSKCPWCRASALRIPAETPGRMGCSFIFRAMNV